MNVKKAKLTSGARKIYSLFLDIKSSICGLMP
jgi:hypothetical protein